MKNLFFFLMLCLSISLQAAEEKKLQELLLPPLPVSIQPQLGLSPEVQNWMDNPKRQREEEARNVKLFASKKLPIFWIVLGIGLLLVAIFVRKHYEVLQLWFRRQWEKPVDIKRESMLAIENVNRKYSSKPSELYIALSEVLRNYLERTFNFHIKEETTQELLEEVDKERTISPEFQNFLSFFFKKADLVKFAHDQPSIEECRVATDQAMIFIEKSTDVMKASNKLR